MTDRPRLSLVRGGDAEGPAEGPPQPGSGPQDANAENSSRQARQPRLVSSPVARVSISPTAARELDGLPLPMRGRVLRVLERLARWPEVSGAKPLRGELAGLHRIRTGDYRVLFSVRGEHVLVERIGHRDRFYED